MDRKQWIYVDGKFVEEKDAVVSVFDHGLLYGDGCFEGIRAYDAMSSNSMTILTGSIMRQKPSL